MTHVARLLVGVGLFVASPAWAGLPGTTVYVDCAAAPGGNGSSTAPYDTVGAGVAAGKVLAATYSVVISVAAGVCGNETFPIGLDYPVHLRGARLPRYDGMGFPIDGQYRDTVVTWTLPSPVPQGVVFVVVTGDDVTVSRMSFDGKVPAQPDVFAPGGPGPTAIDVRGAERFVVESVRIVGAGDNAFRSTGSSGVLAGSYIRSSTGNGMFVGGGDPVARVSLLNNRVSYRTNGIATAGGTVATPTIVAGVALELVAFHNDVTTTYTLTGPTNPAAIRPSPAVNTAANPPDGSFIGWFLYNRISGPARWSIMVHAGFPRFGTHVTGTVQAVFAGTTFDAAAASSDVLLTFTSARATQIPCELNPPPDATCVVGAYSEYLEGASYEFWHTGELDNAQIDHPEFAPEGGYPLDNVLIINDEVVDHQTFVVVP